jgi:N-acetylglucosaminyldiphosphoundecaprenol N-acetyl-beta-D-mannosaminyltransferase
MSLNKKKILGIGITIEEKNTILEYIEKYLKNSSEFKVQSSKLHTKPLVIVTPNPEQIVFAATGRPFANILNRADIAIPDGIGTVWASRMLWRKPLKFRITGIGLMHSLVRKASTEPVSVGLIGGWDRVAVEALECLQHKYPGLHGWAENGPEIEIGDKPFVLRIMDDEHAAISRNTKYVLRNSYFLDLAQKIKQTGTRIVFVGLGAPKQEYFIETLNSQLLTLNIDKPLVLMAVGGAFDVISGRLPRAPARVRQLGFEWLWRLLRQPWRFSRQMALIRFISLVLKSRYIHPA